MIYSSIRVKIIPSIQVSMRKQVYLRRRKQYIGIFATENNISLSTNTFCDLIFEYGICFKSVEGYGTNPLFLFYLYLQTRAQFITNLHGIGFLCGTRPKDLQVCAESVLHCVYHCSLVVYDPQSLSLHILCVCMSSDTTSTNSIWRWCWP